MKKQTCLWIGIVQRLPFSFSIPEYCIQITATRIDNKHNMKWNINPILKVRCSQFQRHEIYVYCSYSFLEYIIYNIRAKVVQKLIKFRSLWIADKFYYQKIALKEYHMKIQSANVNICWKKTSFWLVINRVLI